MESQMKNSCGAESSNNVEHSQSVKSDALEWEEVEIDIGWGKLRGKTRGSGSKRILGLHGWLDNANTFDLIAPMLPEDAQFLSLDLPGHGNSDHFPPGFIYDPRGYMGAVKKAMKVYGWERFILLGHSMGAVVGIIYTSVFPEDVEAFLSLDIIKPHSSAPDRYPALFRKNFNQFFNLEIQAKQEPLVYSEQDLIKKTMEGSNSLDEEGAKLMLNRGAKRSKDGKGLILKRDLRAKAYFIGFISFEAWVELAKSIKCPVFIIKATEGHQFDTKERYEVVLSAFKEGCPHYFYKEMEGKHHIHITHAEIVGSYIRTFLDECRNIQK